MENIKKFFEALSADEKLQARVKSELEGVEGEAKIEKIVAIAKEIGFEFTAEDFQAKKTELSEDELDQVNGGMMIDKSVGDAFLKYFKENFPQKPADPPADPSSNQPRPADEKPHKQEPLIWQIEGKNS